jgi:hypothetical protein
MVYDPVNKKDSYLNYSKYGALTLHVALYERVSEGK